MGSTAVETVAFFTAVISVAWSAAYAWGKWLVHRHDAPRPLAAPDALDQQRLSRLELAVDALAVELERVGEGQRYATRLLDERLPPPRPAGLPAAFGSGSAPGGRVVTPH